jgi:hypothetical protein
MPPQAPSLDVVYVVVFLLGLVFGPSTAAVLGPYAVIFLAATAGASFAIYRATPMPRARMVWFFAWLVGVALIFSGSASILLERWVGENTAHYSVPFVAFAIGATGDDWPLVFRKVKAFAFRWVDKKGGSNESN